MRSSKLVSTSGRLDGDYFASSSQENTRDVYAKGKIRLVRTHDQRHESCRKILF
jgi:hypothetical protein